MPKEIISLQKVLLIQESPKEKILPETEKIIKDAEESLTTNSSSGLIEIQVPDIGDFKNVEIIEILINEGNQINKGDPLITLESDKSSMEVPSPISGIVKEIKVKVGDKVSKGSTIGIAESKDLVSNTKINKEAETTIKPSKPDTIGSSS